MAHKWIGIGVHGTFMVQDAGQFSNFRLTRLAFGIVGEAAEVEVFDTLPHLVLIHIFNQFINNTQKISF